MMLAYVLTVHINTNECCIIKKWKQASEHFSVCCTGNEGECYVIFLIVFVSNVRVLFSLKRNGSLDAPEQVLLVWSRS